MLIIGNFNTIKTQDTTSIVSAFFGLNNAAPIWVNTICPGGLNQDAMPVSFKYSIDETTLSEFDFEVIDNMGNPQTPLCAVLAPADENGENRTVLLIGEFGIPVINPPVEIKIIDDLFTMDRLPEESACSEVMNLNGAYTTNVIPLGDGPSMFFAQRIEGSINECTGTNQTIQVAWTGGITPFIDGDTEEDLYQYYIGYTDSSGTLIPNVPISIADINDNDNFHQLCFSTTDTIRIMAIVENVVEDPNGDPNNYSEIEVSYCSVTSVEIESTLLPSVYSLEQNYPNPFNPSTEIKYSLPQSSNVIIKVFDILGKEIETLVNEEKQTGAYKITWYTENLPSGIYFYQLKAGSFVETKKMLLMK
jgi:hypothetical protein